MTTTQTELGTWMAREIAEQPRVLADLMRDRTAFRRIADHIRRFRPRFVLFAARGSSDHAALYGKYLVEVELGLPAGSVSPSTTTLYGAEPDLRDVLLVTVSQSGGSPDLVEVTESARRRGALTVAVTNTPDSALGEVAEHTLDIGAGPERAVAATKTYTASLLALYLLVRELRESSTTPDADEFEKLAWQCLDTGVQRVDAVAARLRFAERIVTTARGYSLATAAEAGLKLAETSYLLTRYYSAADLLHGPIAAVGAGTAVLAVCGTGPGGRTMSEVLDRLTARGAEVLRVGPEAGHDLPVPSLSENLAPVLEVLPLQQLAWRLAVERGLDPDRPDGLRKTTETR
ncbi:SIS domain-containing protein [Saccharomonospora glauca]|jgi:glucosamine--fructose-6-phosphate aminotransferase (isomerizing)|uniref:Glucosamine 6-phosphate synthetase n=1 Tax=Saccharomonospora glauca K62 TaxID=928724 RepID=I1D1V4_9PSEU|nr:SIS domain-containing protein [Saccharomonospora glauca]EIE98928.1 glucosamine 6-phosphate synthetase [Saccharomonospora glauca K62]